MPGQPGPFSLGAAEVIEQSFSDAGFTQIRSELVYSPLELSSAKECVRFEKESFGALHQMMSSLSDSEKESVWREIEEQLKQFEAQNSFSGPCEMVVAVGEKP